MAERTLDIDPSTPLLYILRNDLGLQGPRFGCGLGQCGASTVIINGAAPLHTFEKVYRVPVRPRWAA
jgi:nicotinate dehydrogenase subunit A